MLIQKGFKYRLLPNEKQKQKLSQHGGNARFLWNLFLKQNMGYYKETGKFKFYHELAIPLAKLKKEYLFLSKSFSQSLQMTARQFEKALKDSFKKEKGIPSFKKKALFNDSFTCTQKWRLGKGFALVPKNGKIKWIKHMAMQGRPKSITISQHGNQWHCSVLCKYEAKEKEKKTDNTAGCSVGLKEFATFSDETVIPNPRHLKKYQDKLAKEQRKLSRKQKGGKNRSQQGMTVRKVHAKIKNAREDYLHKTSNLIATSHDGAVLENLNL